MKAAAFFGGTNIIDRRRYSENAESARRRQVAWEAWRPIAAQWTVRA